MLRGSYDYRHALCEFYAIEASQNNVHFPILPTNWDDCSMLCEVLNAFSEATTMLSGVYYPTSPLALDHCVKIALIFQAYGGYEPNDNDTYISSRIALSTTICSMKEKWLKYFIELPDIFLLAKILDPRVRAKGLEKLLNLYYSALFPQGDGPNPAIVMDKITKCLKEVYREYKINFGSSDDHYNVGSSGGGTSASGGSSSSGGSSLFGLSSNIFKGLYDVYDEHSHKRTRSSTNAYLELDAYLTSHFEYDPQELDNFDILRWWSRRTTNFPILSIIAKEVLACPVSTVAVEQAFSIGGLTLSEKPSKLTVEHLENQCLLDDWVRAANRTQHEATLASDSSEELNDHQSESDGADGQ